MMRKESLHTLLQIFASSLDRAFLNVEVAQKRTKMNTLNRVELEHLLADWRGTKVRML